MAQVKDPVCGMMVDTFSPGGRAIFGGRAFYFCSEACQRQFEANPTRYLDGTVRADAPEQREIAASDPPRTEAGGIVAPKFGSAGSGGAELDPIPDPRRRPGS
jgi:YHS domain-containing protein